MNKEKIYNPTIDYLRVISILAVILIHTTTRILEASGYNLNSYSLTLFLNQIFRFAVPLFFMISGFTLELSYPFHSSYFSFFKKRINKILIPYVLWSTFYYFFVYKKHALDYIHALFLGTASYQLYFIPTLLIFYFLFPLIHNLYIKLSNKWVILILGIIQISILYYDYYIHAFPFYNVINIAFFNYYLFLLGILSRHHIDRILTFVQQLKWLLVPSAIILGAFIFIEGKTLFLKTHNYIYFYSQWRPSILLYTILLSSILYYMLRKADKYSQTIKALSRLSFFVFFIHVLILEMLWYSVGIKVFPHVHGLTAEAFANLAFFAAVTCFSFTIAFLTHKIPKISRITS